MINLKVLTDHFGVETPKSKKPIKAYTAHSDGYGKEGVRVIYITGITHKTSRTGLEKYTIGLAREEDVQLVGLDNAAMVAIQKEVLTLKELHKTEKECRIARAKSWKKQYEDSVVYAKRRVAETKADLLKAEKLLKECEKVLKGAR